MICSTRDSTSIIIIADTGKCREREANRGDELRRYHFGKKGGKGVRVGGEVVGKSLVRGCLRE